MPEKRQRGGQKGNQNAVKHGYYSQAFKKAEQLDFNLAAGLQGFNEEIALLRFEIKKAVSGGDTVKLVPLSKAAYALEKLIRTHHKLYAGNSLRNTLKNAMRDLIIPLGGEKAAFTAIKNWCGYDVLEENNGNQKTNNAQNKTDLTYNEKPISEAV
jgi:hypothetical protein